MIADLFREYLKVTSDHQAAATLVLAHVTYGKTTYLTPHEAAKELNVNVQTVYSLIESGNLKARRVGRQLRIEPADLQNITEPDTGEACFR